MDSVRGVLHRQRGHPAQRLRDVQRQPGAAGLVRDRRHQPVVAALVSDLCRPGDSFTRQRAGNANVLLYQMLRGNSHRFFHDITGVGQSTNNNGLFPVRRKFDLATGIGTPRMGALIRLAGSDRLASGAPATGNAKPAAGDGFARPRRLALSALAAANLDAGPRTSAGMTWRRAAR
jgi:hypothetical protein